MSLLIETNDALPDGVSERMACDVLSLCRNSVRAARARYHFCGPISPHRRRRDDTTQPRALTDDEREHILTVLSSEEFRDQPPAQVYHQLLQQGIYLCSISTMHRLLREAKLNGERRHQRPPSQQPIPRLLATDINQVWTWDIAKLATKRRGEYLSLYVVMDLYSRFIVAWMLSRKENSALSSQLIMEAYDRYGIQPDYPRCFDSYEHAMQWCDDYVTWYNDSHHHSSIANFTPSQVFNGDYLSIATVRQSALDDAYARHPERFSHGRPIVHMPPTEVYINPVPADADQMTIEKGVNFPTLQRVIEKVS